MSTNIKIIRMTRRENEKEGVHRTDEIQTKNHYNYEEGKNILANSNESKTIKLIKNIINSFLQDLMSQLVGL